MRKIIVRNFSVIKSAELELGSMTVLFGPNATGKSLLAKLIHIFESNASAANDSVADAVVVAFAELGITPSKGFTAQYTYDSDCNVTVKFANGKYKASIKGRVEENSDTLFIPAMRSALLHMPDITLSQKDNTLDPFTREFFRRVSIAKDKWANVKPNISVRNLAEKILKGKLEIVDGQERIYDSNGEFIALKQMSSGQQSSLWAIRLLFRGLRGTDNNEHLTIEEPELSLYPETQKYITDILALYHNAGNRVCIVTHSPYVLSEINCLLLADFAGNRGKQRRISPIVPKELWLPQSAVKAYYCGNDGIPRIAVDADELTLICDDYVERFANQPNLSVNEKSVKLADIAFAAKERDADEN